MGAMIALAEEIDIRIFFFINHSWSSGLLDDIFVALTHLGSWTVLLITAALLAGEGRRRFLLHFVSMLAIGLLVVGILRQTKLIVDRERPLRYFEEEIEFGEVWINTPDPSVAAGGKAFPSGHSTMAFYALVYPLLVKRRGAVPLLLLASLIAVSRVYVGTHFITDCIAGAALGSIGALAAARLFFFLEGPGWRPKTAT